MIDAFARRTVPSRTSSEVAAISLGMKRALSIIPSSWRQQVLILSDSEFAIDFYCGTPSTSSIRSNNNMNNSNNIAGLKEESRINRVKGKRKVTPSMELRNAAHRRALLSLMKETPGGVLFSKVRSSSRGVVRKNIGINCTVEIGKIDCDTSMDGIGFIDHDAADHLSSVIRSSVNNNVAETKFGISNVAEQLRWDDMLWLENSESYLASNDAFWHTIEVVGSEARIDRMNRNQRRIERIENMMGLKPIS